MGFASLLQWLPHSSSNDSEFCQAPALSAEHWQALAAAKQHLSKIQRLKVPDFPIYGLFPCGASLRYPAKDIAAMMLNLQGITFRREKKTLWTCGDHERNQSSTINIMRARDCDKVSEDANGNTVRANPGSIVVLSIFQSYLVAHRVRRGKHCPHELNTSTSS